jgi:type I restriction enzyme S subunit
LIRGGNVREHGLAFDDLQFVPDAYVSEKQMLRAGDIVIVASSGSLNGVGKAASVPTGFQGTFGAFCKVIRPSDKVDASYLGHYFRTADYRSKVSSMAAGANINNLRNEHVEGLRIRLPDHSDQRRIAAILDNADQLRAKRRQALGQLDVLIRSIFNAMFGDPVSNAKQWRSQSFGELISGGPQNGLYKPASCYGAGTPIVRIDSFSGGSIQKIDSLKLLRASASEVSLYGLQEDDILINRVNSMEHLGKSALVPRLSQPTVFESNIMRCRIDFSTLNPVYASVFLQSQFIRNQVNIAAKRAVNQASINQTDVKSFTFRVPPLEIQQEFAERVGAIELVRARSRLQLAELDALFASLQSRAFNGEL